MSKIVGGATDFLFGQQGREGTPGEVVDVTPGEFEDLRGPIRDVLLSLYQPGATGASEPFAAPVTPEEQATVDAITAALPVGQQSIGAGRGTLQATASGEFVDPSTNPFLEGAIEAAVRPLREEFQRVTLPRLQTGFTRAGQKIQPESSSPFDEAVAIATDSLLNNVADITSRIGFATTEAERQRQQEAAAILPQFEAGALGNLVTGLQAQALPRLVEDLGIERGLSEFNRMITNLLQAIGLGISAASPRGQVATIQPTAGTEGVGGQLPGLLGGAGALLQGAGGLAAFSEEAFKENIVRLGEVPKLKSNLYRWNYKGRPEDEKYVGFMIDEIVKVHPEAVSEMRGIRTLNYMKLEDVWREAA